MSRGSFVPEPGERAIIVGQTGSGKTAFAMFLLEHIPRAPVVIYDTKIEPKFDTLVPNIVVRSIAELDENIDNKEVDYIIVRPPDEELGNAQVLDEYLWHHYKHYHGVTAFIDEAMMFMISRGRAGKGLLSLMQRGRSKGICTIMCTQRPVGVDRSCITEASMAFIFYLGDKADKKRLDDVIPNFSSYPPPMEHGFYFFRSGQKVAELMRPIKLDASRDTGYVDVSQVSVQGGGENHEQIKPVEGPNTGHVWI